jgi:hypothetical protein
MTIFFYLAVYLEQELKSLVYEENEAYKMRELTSNSYEGCKQI